MKLVTKAVATVGTAILLVVTAGQASGPDYPTIAILYEKTDFYSRLQIQCKPAAPEAGGSRRRIDCELTQVVLSPPKSAAEVAKEVAEEDRAIRAEHAKDQNKFWSGWGKFESEGLGKITDPEQLASMRALIEIGKKRDLDGLMRFLADASQRKTKTCKMTVNTTRETLTQVDVNTWGGTVGPLGWCNATRVLTLWRKPGDGALWNYKQVRTMPENQAEAGLCEKADRVSVADFRWDASNGKRLGCEYIE